MSDLKSSMIKSCAFNARNGEMTVCFHKGGRHALSGVSQKLYDDFVKAESPGSFYHHHLRGKFPSKKLEDE